MQISLVTSELDPDKNILKYRLLLLTYSIAGNIFVWNLSVIPKFSFKIVRYFRK